MIPTVVINLPQSAQRRDFMAAQLGALGIPYRLFSAVDGRRMPASQRARYGPLLGPAAIGCIESHLAVLREIAGGADEFVCVLEDDAELSPDVTTLLDARTLERLERFDVLRLEGNQRPGRRLKIPLATFPGFALVAGYRQHIAMTGQIFSRRGARTIVDRIPAPRLALDVMLFHETEVFGLRVIETRPSLVTPHAGFASTIGIGPVEPLSPWRRFLVRQVRIREIRAILSFAWAWGPTNLVKARVS